MGKSKTAAILGLWLLFTLLTVWFDYEPLNYYGVISNTGFILVLIIFGLIVGGMQLGLKMPAIQIKALKKNGVLELGLYYVPLFVLILITLTCLVLYQPNSAVDAQAYRSVLDSLEGKAIIHLLPAGLAYRLLSKKITTPEIIFVMSFVLGYTFFLSERLYLVPFIFLFVLHKIRLDLLSLQQIAVLALMLVMVFVASELTRSFLFFRLSQSDLTLYSALEYAFLRFPVYYADAIFKSASCFEAYFFDKSMQSCSRESWESVLLTNRGSISELLEVVGFHGVFVSSIALGIITGNAIKQYEKGENTWMCLLSPYLVTAIFEFPRFGYILTGRFWYLVFVLALIFLLVKPNESSPKVTFHSDS